MSNKTKLTTNRKERQTMQNLQTKSNRLLFRKRSILTYALYLAPILLCNIDAMAAFDLDAGIKAATDPVKKMINDYYPVGIFITGAIGALMQQQGDLRDRMMGFGKGSLVGGLTVMAVKAGLGV
ncbi:hypothetical protein Megvenef_01066 [Candidatus Megaera venefica]|uniref:Conjugal transfer protein TrbC n=1 Tax=Candidatus Megaera venefica TaxID=2055910 RepID=A0ABU5ND46_9RICK|nr:hypothetical protein [Candidatus Megaera venefica]MEA0971094.1 hypothetical protein [Candidatus Megaera venefica]